MAKQKGKSQCENTGVADHCPAAHFNIPRLIGILALGGVLGKWCLFLLHTLNAWISSVTNFTRYFILVERRNCQTTDDE